MGNKPAVVLVLLFLGLSCLPRAKQDSLHGMIEYIPHGETIPTPLHWFPDRLGGGGLFPSFRKTDSTSSVLNNQGKPINTQVCEHCSMVTPEGKSLFFVRFSEVNSNIYRVGAGIIEALRLDNVN
jgi:hypothetical protein